MLEAASLFTDGAVLCREKEIRVFGRADDGAEVTARLTDARGEALAESTAAARDGKFLVFLPPQRAQTGCRLTITDGTETAAAGNVAIGDVYLAGGQSNMEMELRNALGGTEPITDDPMLRFFNVPRKAYPCAEQQQALRETRWHAVDRETAGYNSAVASYFGAAMRRKHPEIPVGIIGCYWGGTSVTCWTEEEALRSVLEGCRYLEDYEDLCDGKTLTEYLEEEEAFNRNLAEWNRKVEAYREGHPGAAWEEVEGACGKCPWDPPAGPGSPYRPAGLIETMLKETAPYTLTAALFYQGEEDTWRTEQYDRLLTAMIGNWRKLFRNPELPFLFVQLPMWIDFGTKDTYQWPRTRLAQAAVRDSVRNTGMICLLDEGEFGNIHPVNKRPVGERLAETAGRMLYGEGEESPRAAGRWVRGGRMHVLLTQTVMTSDGGAPRLLEIAGEDGVFHPAEAEVAGRELRIHSEQVKYPSAARYAWTDWSDRVNLFGVNGLPLEPFWV